MALKKHRAPLLCYFKLCISFHSHPWIQTGVTVRKRPIRVKISDALSRMTLKFDACPGKTIEHIFYATSSIVYHFVAICEFKLEMPKLGQNWFWPLWLWPLTSHLPRPFARTSPLSMVIAPENFMLIRWEENCEKGVTDRQTYWTILRAAWS